MLEITFTMEEDSSLVCDDLKMWRVRVSTLEVDIANMRFSSEVARDNHELEIATLQGRISGGFFCFLFFLDLFFLPHFQH